ncbi:MAG TPA: glycogen/starch/alpha-glucan phosphorylase [Myxococcota bacterium]|nr:glycogen/starch/alpha-glucan phosphorylase [Myxococcota bacterium]HRY94593.1 glycogen/starch/alpha-glucan phosphorylase [Myxococcota bacterium]HSA20325.1 glycogen/starch/alpha-glucan phosphorylase [Myxococcota bacterium]
MGAGASGPVRTGTSAIEIRQAILDNLACLRGKFPEVATKNDYYLALAYAVRDRLLDRWTRTAHTYFEQASRTVCYLSAEFLLGPHLGNNLVNLGIEAEVREAVSSLGLDLDELLDQEEEPGLGNGGLGRLAACYLDSLATLAIPAIGYGLRYEFGIFDQQIRDGWQVEATDKWLRSGNPWEIHQPEIAFEVKLGGMTVPRTDQGGNFKVDWLPERVVKGVAYDTPIQGYRTGSAIFLRLWKAEACESFDFSAFNVGDYYRAVQEKLVSENITKVLYPNDEPLAGKQLRLQQQYFFASCSLQDMIRIHLQRKPNLDDFHKKYAVQLNDTHPSVGVAELMRLLVDEHGYAWDTAWEITRQTFAYTNHTLLPEALERWPVQLFQSLLPRHLEIIYEVNRRFLEKVRARYPGDAGKVSRLSLIDEGGERSVRMANLACVGSFAINGVARLHSTLLRQDVLRDFAELWPEKFSNKTNGVTPRRFLVLANPRLTELISARIGDDWIRELDGLRGLEPLADERGLQEAWRQVKLANKRDLAAEIQRRTGVRVDPASLFDVQVKRIHEYKRQHLNLLHVMALYLKLTEDPRAELTPRTVILGGKAAPGYRMAKLIIKLAHCVADLVNNDPRVGGRLKLVFFPDFNVKSAQRVYPGADLSEQISTAGKEASGTGCMKFAMNGALTIGTLDGANIEIREEVGAENFFLFGLTAEEVADRRCQGNDPGAALDRSPLLGEVLRRLREGQFSNGDRELFRPLLDSLTQRDDYMLLSDFPAYLEAQRQVAKAFRDPTRWTRMSILNTARAGKFSSDRAIREYCQDLWKVEPVRIDR